MDTKFSTGLGAVRRTSLDANSANLKEWGRDDTVLDRHLGKTGAYVQTVRLITGIPRFAYILPLEELVQIVFGGYFAPR